MISLTQAPIVSPTSCGSLNDWLNNDRDGIMAMAKKFKEHYKMWVPHPMIYERADSFWKVLFRKWSDSPHPAKVCVNLGDRGLGHVDVSVWYFGNQDAYHDHHSVKNGLWMKQLISMAESETMVCGALGRSTWAIPSFIISFM